MSITQVAAGALTELVGDARTLRDRAEQIGHENAVHKLDGIAQTLDAARTRLVQEGGDYLDAAWAFIDGGRVMLAGWSRAVAESEERCRARA